MAEREPEHEGDDDDDDDDDALRKTLDSRGIIPTISTSAPEDPSCPVRVACARRGVCTRIIVQVICLQESEFVVHQE